MPTPHLATKLDTKEALLDAAESLFADRGLGHTSLRAITQAAGANLASVNYHFGSKDALVHAVLERRLQPLNAERLELLDALEEEAGGAPVAVEPILRAFLRPPFHLAEAGGDFTRFLGRLHFEADHQVQEILLRIFQPVIERFAAALGQALPGAAAEDLLWRLHFCIGALAMSVTNPSLLVKATGGLCDPGDTEATLERLVRFCAAGFGDLRGRA